ncbi:MAG: HEAT repeat domain-containing protein [Kofleriaceae bacterium]
MIIGVSAATLAGFALWLGHATTSSDAAPAAEKRIAVVAPPHAPGHLAARPAPAMPAPGLAADLRDPDPRVRRAAVTELAHSDARDPATLLAASRDPDPNVALAATEGLGALYRDGRITAKELADRITDHALGEKIRVAAMNELGIVPAKDAATLLADLVAHGDVGERRSAAILLSHQDPAVAVPALIGVLADADEYVRLNAVESLKQLARGRDFGQDAAAWTRWWQSRQG